MISEDFFVSDLTKSLSTKLYCWADNLLWFFLGCLSFYGFSTDSSGKKSSFYTHGVCTVCNVTHVACPFAPYTVSTVHCSILSASKEFTCGRTSFRMSQYMHNLLIVLSTKFYYCDVSSLDCIVDNG